MWFLSLHKSYLKKISIVLLWLCKWEKIQALALIPCLLHDGRKHEDLKKKKSNVFVSNFLSVNVTVNFNVIFPHVAAPNLTVSEDLSSFSHSFHNLILSSNMQLVPSSPSAYQAGRLLQLSLCNPFSEAASNEYVHWEDLGAEGHRQSTLDSIMRVKVNDSLQWSEAFRILQIKSACQSWQCRKDGITCVRNRESCKDKMVSVLNEDYMEFSVANQIVNLRRTCNMISLHQDVSRL